MNAANNDFVLGCSVGESAKCKTIEYSCELNMAHLTYQNGEVPMFLLVNGFYTTIDPSTNVIYTVTITEITNDYVNLVYNYQQYSGKTIKLDPMKRTNQSLLSCKYELVTTNTSLIAYQSTG